MKFIKKSLINLSLDFDNKLIRARLKLNRKIIVGLKRLRQYVLSYKTH